MKRFLGLLAAVALFVWAPAAQAAPSVIDLRNDAVTTFISSFGAPNTATYGQLVTAPPGAAQITNFGFRVEGIPANAIFTGEIYAWDGKKATGLALYESPFRETTGIELQDVTFETGGTPVVPGTQYVLFMSISKIFEGNPNFSSKFRALTKTESEAIYPAGKFVYLNNGTNEGEWTTEKWSSREQDLQFTARFISQQQLTVTKSGNGSGTVTSDIGGINCGAICSATFLEDTVVTLTASAGPGSTFLGFSGGGCSASPCQVTINNAHSVNAAFADTTAPKATITKHTKKKIVFKSSEPGSTFKCKLDKRKFKPCKSPFKLKGLKAGRHHFSVVATDPGGNVSKPAKLKFSSE